MGVTFAEACKTAEEAKDPILAMLKDADQRLNREDPDIIGAMCCVHAARLAVALRLLEPPPMTEDIKRLVELTRKLVIFQNFGAHPGHHPGDRSGDAKDPPSYRQGWIDAVHAMHDRVNAPTLKEMDHGEG